ncbi:MAG: hypothetical protein LUQ22_07690 [Methanotrichaceae archaeon]|nr:hypothetical protein [Methanotrichaceae archaeon]
MIVVTSSKWILSLIVLLLFSSPALCAGETVLIDQAGSTREPFDVGGSLNFRVPINNDISASMRYTVKLTIGPNINDYSIFKEYVQYPNVNAKSSAEELFENVNYRTPELIRGEYGQWASDRNDTSIWEKAWYRAEIIPLLGKTVILEDYNGHPRLFKAFFDFRNPGVTPTQGTNKDLYSYEVTVFGSYRDNISLQVGPSVEGPWTDMGSRYYATPGLIQTMKWDNVTLDFDFSMAYYRFKGTRQSKVFEGPFWPVIVNNGNGSVTPERGLSNTQFDYGIDVVASKKIDVGLNVLDVGSKTFKLAGRAAYKNVSQWERLEWSGIQPSEISGSEGSSSYYFTFHYPGAEMPFNKTKQYPGPDIVLINFQNATVTPRNGSALTSFTYWIDVNTGLPRCDVELQTLVPGSSKWTSQGLVTYDGSNRSLSWMDIEIDGKEGGLASFRFISGGSRSEIYSGPYIQAPEVVGIVEPARGVFKVMPEAKGLRTFTYTAEFKNWTEPGEIWADLLTRTPNSTWVSVGEKQQLNPARANITWTVIPFYDVEFLGPAEFKFLINDKESKIFTGPEIFAMYKDPEFQDLKNGKFNYLVSLNGSEDLTIDLTYSSNGKDYINVGKPQSYTGGSGWKRISWNDLPPYYFYDFAIRPKG